MTGQSTVPTRLPFSFYAVLVTFGVFFASVLIYVMTRLLDHPWASDLWLVGVTVGAVGLVVSIRLVRRDQERMVRERAARGGQQEEGAESPA